MVNVRRQTSARSFNFCHLPFTIEQQREEPAAERVPAYGAEYLSALLQRPATPPQAPSGTLALLLKGVPEQTEIDRQLNLYEAYVRREPALVGAGR